ncbi:MAG: hypothetical protein JW976_12525 [Syntrophaceae bacterium]|nr:hypothetical protein [Syntrophaceae bacterium]
MKKKKKGAGNSQKDMIENGNAIRIFNMLKVFAKKNKYDLKCTMEAYNEAVKSFKSLKAKNSIEFKDYFCNLIEKKQKGR